MRRNECDLLLRNVKLEDRSELTDIAIDSGKIIRIESGAEIISSNIVDVQGALASPPFIDPHTHLDKVLFKPSPNRSGTLAEAIEIMSGSPTSVLHETIQERADKVLTWAFKHGTLAVRTHVDITAHNSAIALEEVVKVKDRWKDFIDVQIVAFPQEGLFSNPLTLQYLRDALKTGADLIGGIPDIERTQELKQRHIEKIFELAAEFDVDIDMHIDESDNPDSTSLESLADMTISAGWLYRVTAAHCCALSAYRPEYANQVIAKVHESKINIVTNPTTNLVLQGRDDENPKRRGVTLVKELLEAGVNVSFGQDNIRDVFNPFGKGDMLDIAFVTALAAHMTGEHDMQQIFDMPRYNAAKILKIDDYGLREGNTADIVLFKAESIIDAIASRPSRDWIVRRGKILSAVEISQGVIL